MTTTIIYIQYYFLILSCISPSVLLSQTAAAVHFEEPTAVEVDNTVIDEAGKDW
jgi:hypothetical protein